ncbi:BrnA antitoxin family protein [Terracidiphilus sp.]|uniref:BrnA antitoxin family protein n=1 Tax=Terracidiphilus sp. TaxID=1964191 RepID=UPI003C1457D7
MNTSATGMVKFRFDPNNPPEMTEEQMQRLREMRDEDIDFSDIPNQAGTTGWRRVSDLVPSDNKSQITLRLDADVLAFFRSTGRRYQSRINAALREYMLAHKPAR